MNKTIIAAVLLGCLTFSSCGSTGQLYFDVNQNTDFEAGEDVRHRQRFKLGYKINLGEKHVLLRTSEQKELAKLKVLKQYEKIMKEEGWKQ